MKIDFTQSAGKLIADLFKDLERATVDRKHPFRFFSLSTTEVDNIPTQRTVVLRSVQPSNEMLIYTDYRTPKVQEVKLQNQVSLLFYHPKKKVQIRFQATATIHHQDALCLREWNKIGVNGRNDYQTILPPGSDLPARETDKIHDVDLGSNFFSIISLKPDSLDLLKLSRAGHQRMVGQFENGAWTGRRVMP